MSDAPNSGELVSVDQGDSARGWSSWCAKGLREELLRLRLVLGASARPSFSWSKVCLKHLKSVVAVRLQRSASDASDDERCKLGELRELRKLCEI